LPVVRSFHVRLIVADFDGCFRFYRDVLGLKVTWGEEADGSASGYASFQTPDGASLSVNDQSIFAPVVGFATREPGEPVKDRAALIFEVEDVAAEAERLRALGVALETEPTAYPGFGIRAAHLRDPDGNLIEINELLPSEEWSDSLRDEEERFREGSSSEGG
jgi:catechol 2,3-dioxygenase-like lactoylglutathione lyase family enzyme